MALRHDLIAKAVLNPGSRGGQYWRDKKGGIRYGKRPMVGASSVFERVKRRAPGKGGHVALSRKDLETLLSSGRYALVSAGPNPNYEKDKHLTEDEIKRRHEQLGKDLVAGGYMFTNVTGHYGGIEDSYLVMVHDADRKDVIELGKKYRQDSVVYGEGGKQEMHFTFGEHIGTMHVGRGYEIKNDAEDFYTIVRHPDGSSTKFSLNFDWDSRHRFLKALKVKAKDKSEEGPNDHLGEKPVDAPVGYSPRIVQVPMNQNADVNPRVHAARQEEKKTKLVVKALKGEGSRGGHVFGHTKNGKPIYRYIVRQFGYPLSIRKEDHGQYEVIHQPEGGTHPGGKEGHLVRYAPAIKEISQIEPMSQLGVYTSSEQAHAAIEDHHKQRSSLKKGARWSDKDERMYQHIKDSGASTHIAAATVNKRRRKEGRLLQKKKGPTVQKSNNVPQVFLISKRTLGWIDKHKEATRALIHGSATDEVKKSLADEMDGIEANVTKSIGGTMSNEVSDLFKAELGNTGDGPLTSCVHCKQPLTRDDLRKGLGTHFVADDNDNPHSGPEGGGSVEPSRGVPGAHEHDEIAPLLKGLKGPEAGDAEEYPIHKSEMETMGMNVESLDDGWYTITKAEMNKHAPNHLAYLVARKSEAIQKALPDVSRAQVRVKDGKISGPHGVHASRMPVSHSNPNPMGGTDKPAPQKLTVGAPVGSPIMKSNGDEGPHGYSPRAGGVHGPSGEPLVIWETGTDAQVAAHIEKSGGFGFGTDESVRTRGPGSH